MVRKMTLAVVILAMAAVPIPALARDGGHGGRHEFRSGHERFGHHGRFERFGRHERFQHFGRFNRPFRGYPYYSAPYYPYQYYGAPYYFPRR
jgi:hypothetical protein